MIYHRIRHVAAELNVKPYVIRYWEQEFSIRPLRSKRGQRVYTPQMVDKLREIKRLLKVELYTIAGAKRQLRAKPLRIAS